MLIVISAATAGPGRRAELVRAAVAMARAARDTPGCLSYSFQADLENEDVLRGVEVRESQEALNTHMRQDRTRAFLAHVPELITVPPELTIRPVADPA